MNNTTWWQRCLTNLRRNDWFALCLLRFNLVLIRAGEGLRQLSVCVCVCVHVVIYQRFIEFPVQMSFQWTGRDVRSKKYRKFDVEKHHCEDVAV